MFRDVNWGSFVADDIKWLTAPLGGGPVADPPPTPPDNPNSD
jgi:hypothetical protein